MNTKNIVTSAVISLVVAILVFSIFGGKTTERVVDRQIVGANPSQNEIVGSDTWTVNGVKYIYKKQPLSSTATTTPCSIATPVGATTTLLSFAMNVTTSTSTALSFDIGTSTTPYATTTKPMVAFGGTTALIASGVKYNYIWSSGASTTGMTDVLPPFDSVGRSTNFFKNASSSNPDLTNTSWKADWLVTKFPKLNGAGVVLGGTCSAVFREI